MNKIRKSSGYCCLFVISALISSCSSYGLVRASQPGARPIGSLVDQYPPKSTAVIFAPGVVSTEQLEIEGVFSPDMREFYFVRQVIGERPKLHMLHFVGGEWLEKVEDRPLGEVFIAPNGKRMHLGNSYRERTRDGWSEEKSLGPLFDDFPIMRLTTSEAGTYVFDVRDEENGGIRFSRLIEGKRQDPKFFGESINTGAWIGHPFISPDESYIIWDAEREGGYGQSDLYISFRRENGDWGSAINLGPEINSDVDDAYASITPDGNYLLFHRIDLPNLVADIYWIDAQIIEDLRVKDAD